MKMGRGKEHKKPKVLHSPADVKSVRAGYNPDDANQQTPCWKIGRFDKDGCWGKDAVQLPDHLWDDLFNKLSNYESMTWASILQDKKRNHSVPINDLCKEARDRLEALKLDDVDDLFRFRLSGEQRVWGMRDRQIFYLLWWDPNHQVCPSTLKNT